MNVKENEWLWVEKYRPQNLDECILPKEFKKTLSELVSGGQLPNLMFCGSAGCGKTTVAKALCHMLDLDYILINGSEENGIDVLRNKIKQFASTVSLSGGYKVVILDESDHLQQNSTQPALRAFIEEFSNNCRFIFTCNFKNRIIEPLHSRCSVIDFNTNKKQLASLAGEFLKRLKDILKHEGVQAQEKTLAELIIRHAPDWRRVLNECQRYATSGTISTEILACSSDENFHSLVGYLRDKDFKSMRSWVANNTSLDGTTLFRKIYDGLYESVEPSSIPAAVLILADYSYKSAFVSDKELNVVACMTELMSNITWKLS